MKIVKNKMSKVWKRLEELSEELDESIRWMKDELIKTREDDTLEEHFKAMLEVVEMSISDAYLQVKEDIESYRARFDEIERLLQLFYCIRSLGELSKAIDIAYELRLIVACVKQEEMTEWFMETTRAQNCINRIDELLANNRKEVF